VLLYIQIVQGRPHFATAIAKAKSAHACAA
jgi:hypothetical protein